MNNLKIFKTGVLNLLNQFPVKIVFDQVFQSLSNLFFWMKAKQIGKTNPIKVQVILLKALKNIQSLEDRKTLLE